MSEEAFLEVLTILWYAARLCLCIVLFITGSLGLLKALARQVQQHKATRAPDNSLLAALPRRGNDAALYQVCLQAQKRAYHRGSIIERLRILTRDALVFRYGHALGRDHYFNALSGRPGAISKESAQLLAQNPVIPKSRQNQHEPAPADSAFYDHAFAALKDIDTITDGTRRDP